MISLPDPLPNDPDLLKQMLRDAVVGRQADQDTSLLRQRLFGRKSEQSTDPNSPQLGMFNEAENLAEASPTAEDEEIVAPEPAKKRGKRKPLPAELPRVEVMHELPEHELTCDCGCHKQAIGEETSEQLEIIPMQIRVIRHIRRGGPVTVTHPKITRYFMTIPEAAQLVIQAGAMGQGGDVFVLDMGEPVTILELARKMIMLSGLTVCDERNPNGDIAITFSGLRPGEKLYEELLIGDNPESTTHPKIHRANEVFLAWNALLPILDTLRQAVRDDNYELVRETLLSTVQGYSPTGGIVDLLYQQHEEEVEDQGSVRTGGGAPTGTVV